MPHTPPVPLSARQRHIALIRYARRASTRRTISKRAARTISGTPAHRRPTKAASHLGGGRRYKYQLSPRLARSRSLTPRHMHNTMAPLTLTTHATTHARTHHARHMTPRTPHHARHRFCRPDHAVQRPAKIKEARRGGRGSPECAPRERMFGIIGVERPVCTWRYAKEYAPPRDLCIWESGGAPPTPAGSLGGRGVAPRG